MSMDEPMRMRGLPHLAPGERYLILVGLEGSDVAPLAEGLELVATALGCQTVELEDISLAVDELVRVREAGAFPALVVGSRVDDELVAQAARSLADALGVAPVVRWSATSGEEGLARLVAAGCCDVIDHRHRTSDDLLRGLRLAFEISRRRQAEAQLTRWRYKDGLSAELEAEARRYAGTGRLLISISHDLNNLLQPVIGYADLLHDRFGAGSEEAEHLGVMRRSAELAQTLVRRLVRLGRTGQAEHELVDPDRLLESLDPLVRSTVGSRARLDTVLGSPGVRLELPAGALEQLVLNLVANARDAMPTGGTVTLRSRRAGASWCLEIEDTGAGIAPADRSRVFDSGYTTKGEGRGSGLGLWIVRALVSDAGGSVAIEKADQRGTRVRILLPLVPPE